MKLLVFLLILILALYTLSRKTCYSSGDPHFKTFHGYTPDLYGVTGDLLLTRAKDHTFSVITRVRYGKHWANRGLNSAISVKIDGNIYNNYGSYWEVNGVKNGKFINNVEFKNSGTHHYISSRKTGQHVEFRWYYVGHFNGFTDYYFNVYLSIPDKYYGKMVGLCGNGAGDFKSDVKNWQHWTSAKKGKKFFRCVLPLKNQHNHFDVKYVPKPSQHVFEKIKWKNEEQKNKAHEYCYEKLKLRNNLYKDCVYDVKVGGGDMSMAKGYKTAAKDIKHVDGSKKKSGTYDQIYEILKQLRNEIFNEIEALKKKIVEAKEEKIKKTKASNENIKKSTEMIELEKKNIVTYKSIFKQVKVNVKNQKGGLKEELKIIRKLIGVIGHQKIKHLKKENKKKK